MENSQVGNVFYLLKGQSCTVDIEYHSEELGKMIGTHFDDILRLSVTKESYILEDNKHNGIIIPYSYVRIVRWKEN